MFILQKDLVIVMVQLMRILGNNTHSMVKVTR